MGSGAYLRTRCSTEPTWERPWGLITELPDQGQVPLLDLSPQGKESPSLLKTLHGQLLSPTAKSTLSCETWEITHMVHWRGLRDLNMHLQFK